MSAETGAENASDATALAARLLAGEVEAGTLYIVSTPIGNLGDISLRALAILNTVSRILCEDTRHARTLLLRYGIYTPTSALHSHNEAQSLNGIIAELKKGVSFALISDAGTPLVSDPGERLVRAVCDEGLNVVPVPGASAALAALAAAGVDAHPSTIMGFLPRKGGERKKALEWIAANPYTVVVYESPNRVIATLQDIADYTSAQKYLVVCRELTKKFEEFRRGTIADLIAYYNTTGVRGEFVLVIPSSPPTSSTDEDLRAKAVELRNQGMSARDIVRQLSDVYGASRNLAYKLAHE